jgi:hypothetical protein
MYVVDEEAQGVPKQALQHYRPFARNGVVLSTSRRELKIKEIYITTLI